MAAKKRLYRSDTNRMIAGVCGGLEDFTGIDATVWRLIFAVLLLPGGLPGLVPYIIMWIVIPRQSSVVSD